ncbi:MAG: Hpt domain-containing protein [Desulfohalobiaceae bacterium]|nr:Hpt domain-containing protein [Desulfohalobiaceae bacterium]
MIQSKQPEQVKEYLDLDNLRNRFSGKSRLLFIMKQEFVALQQSVIPEMQSAYAEQNRQALKDLAHTLKGNAALIGALRVREMSEQIEALSDEDLESLKNHLDQLPSVMRQTIDYLEWFLEDRDSCLEDK